MCGAAATCLIRHEGPLAGFTGSWATSLVRLSDGAELALGAGSVALPRGGGAAAWVCADGGASPCAAWPAALAALGCAADGSDCVLRAALFDGAGASVDAHADLLAIPAALVLPRARVHAFVSPTRNPDGSVSVYLNTNATAVFVTLTTTEQGVFDDNAFLLTTAECPRIVNLLPIIGAGAVEPAALVASLRIEHLAIYSD